MRDARYGDVRWKIDVRSGIRSHGWESDDTLLYTTSVETDRTVMVRCSVSSEECRTVASFPSTAWIPQPLETAGQ